jgi:hypothetical protein
MRRFALGPTGIPVLPVLGLVIVLLYAALWLYRQFRGCRARGSTWSVRVEPDRAPDASSRLLAFAPVPVRGRDDWDGRP